MKKLVLSTICLSFFLAGSMRTTAAQDEPYAVEYYYKIKWGHFEEFMELYKKNHYPILVELQKLGRIVEMTAAYPRYHAGEGSRWDFRYTIVWKNVTVATEDYDTDPIIERLYPDRARFEAEEQRRFQLFEEHLDIPVERVDLNRWSDRP